MEDVILVVIAMLLHEMALYDRSWKAFEGLVDCKTALPEYETTEAVVLMIVSLTGNWKHPITYVLQDKCSAGVRAQLISDCIVILSEEDINILAFMVLAHSQINLTVI